MGRGTSTVFQHNALVQPDGTVTIFPPLSRRRGGFAGYGKLDMPTLRGGACGDGLLDMVEQRIHGGEAQKGGSVTHAAGMSDVLLRGML